MARNVEIKAHIRDKRHVRDYMKMHGVQHETQHQRDVFFLCIHGRLKLRCFPDGTGVLVAYDRPDRSGPKISDYTLVQTENAAALESALTRTLGVRGVVEKKREIAIVGQTRVHLDVVSELGTFLELEVVLRPDQTEKQGEAIARKLMEDLQVNSEDLIDRAYIDMLDQKRP